MKIKATLLLVIFFCISTHAFAVDSNIDEEVVPELAGVEKTTVSLTISNSGKLTCYGSVFVESGYKANVNWSLQSTTSGIWSNTNSWFGSKNGPSFLELNEVRYAVHGYQYRIKAEIKTYRSNGAYIKLAHTSGVQLLFNSFRFPGPKTILCSAPGFPCPR